MQFSIWTQISAVASIALAAPFNPFPLANGFPNLNATALQKVFSIAGGTAPNGPLPTSLTLTGAKTFQVIALNEFFEVAYFTELLFNITSGVQGYENGDKASIKEALTVIINACLTIPCLY
jgi:hypothetical protein